MSSLGKLFAKDVDHWLFFRAGSISFAECNRRKFSLSCVILHNKYRIFFFDCTWLHAVGLRGWSGFWSDRKYWLVLKTMPQLDNHKWSKPDDADASAAFFPGKSISIGRTYAPSDVIALWRTLALSYHLLHSLPLFKPFRLFLFLFPFFRVPLLHSFLSYLLFRFLQLQGPKFICPQ